MRGDTVRTFALLGIYIVGVGDAAGCACTTDVGARSEVVVAPLVSVEGMEADMLPKLMGTECQAR